MARVVAMVQFAVALKEQDWTVFQDGRPIASQLSRSAAVAMAEQLAWDAEERGERVELVIQDYIGELASRRSGGEDDD